MKCCRIHREIKRRDILEVSREIKNNHDFLKQNMENFKGDTFEDLDSIKDKLKKINENGVKINSDFENFHFKVRKEKDFFGEIVNSAKDLQIVFDLLFKKDTIFFYCFVFVWVFFLVFIGNYFIVKFFVGIFVCFICEIFVFLKFPGFFMFSNFREMIIIGFRIILLFFFFYQTFFNCDKNNSKSNLDRRLNKFDTPFIQNMIQRRIDKIPNRIKYD